MVQRSISSAREAAYRALAACAQQGAWADKALKRSEKSLALSAQDAALASVICYGVVQNRILLDYWVRHFCSVAPEKLEMAARLALEMGMYQVHFLERIPAHAAVSESVELVKRYGKNPNSHRLVNGVLRTFVRQKDSLPFPEDKDPIRLLSVLYSHPYWLTKLLSGRLDPPGLEQLLKLNNTPCPVVVQTNLLKNTPEQLAGSLQCAGVQACAHAWLPGCFILSGAGNLEKLAAFQDGAFWVQDAAAMLAVLAAQPRPGERVLDACAAPGGKSFAIAGALKHQGELISCDIHPHKIELIRAGAQRLGIGNLSAQLKNAKAFDPDWTERFDLVVADVPCSGLGIIRKKPDIREKDPELLAQLPTVQSEILNNLCHYVRPGGRLLYATCTLLEQENEDVVRRFLHAHPEFHLEAFALPGPIGSVPEGWLTLWPHLHGTDGFFIAKLRKCHA